MNELRKKTQSMIDALHGRFKDCELVMLIDQKAGLILSKSSDSPTSQTKVEQVATDALAEMNAPSVETFGTPAREPELLLVTRIQRKSIMFVIQDKCCGEDALVCVFKKQPNRSYLMEVASEIFQLPMMTAEA